MVFWGLKVGTLPPCWDMLTVTSHMTLRAHDHYISSTLIGGKGKASPSSLPTILEGPLEYMNARRM